MKTQSRKPDTAGLARVAMMAAVMAVCAWLCVPLAVPVTMQTFGVLFALVWLGPREGTLALAVYLALGCLGLPVFSGFQGGLATALGPTGGYLWGLLLGSLTYGPMTRLRWPPALCLGVVLAVSYGLGTLWYWGLYARNLSWGGALGTCVVPLLLPDGAKLLLALELNRRMRKRGSQR